MGFTAKSDVIVKEIDEQNWQVVQPLEYQGKEDRFVVPAGMLTDFASVPRLFVWFLPRYGRYTKAAILHDHLWRDLASSGRIAWLDADALFRRAMRELGVPFLKRWIMWAAVRWGALVKAGGRAGWWKESWRVLLVTIPALPIVLPPAVLILAALAAFYLLELMLWVPIRLGSLVATAVRKRPPRKQVNLPTFGWKLS